MNYQIAPWISLVAAIIVTTVIWIIILDFDNQSHKLEFIALTEKITLQIEDSLETHEQVLRGFEGLFSASIEVTPLEFTNFFYIQKIPERFPDLQGVGYIEHVSSEKEKKLLTQKLKNYGIEYEIYPEGTRSEYYPVVFLEPQDFRNKRAIGYDVYSEEIRREAVEKSKEMEKTVLTGKIILVQETEENIQNGFLMLLPVYSLEENTGEISKFQGFVYSVFRMNDFVEGILGSEIFNDIEVKIFDGVPEEKNQFFSSGYFGFNPSGNVFSHNQILEFGERTWSITYVGDLPNAQNIQNTRLIIPITGYAMSFLLFYSFFLFSKNIKLNKTMIKQERISVLGELASRFSHDIRNPLSNIQLAIGIIKHKKELESNKDIEEKFQIIEKNLDRISHQVENVLDFVRIHPLQKEKLNLTQLLIESIDSLTVPKNIKINLPKNDAISFVDSYQIQIVFKNLITNSIQAIGEKEGEITIKIIDALTETIIEFVDSGPGLSGLNSKEIFEILTTTKQTGTGLGLVTCKQIIENHGGTIEVKEKPTKFTIKIPKE